MSMLAHTDIQPKLEGREAIDPPKAPLGAMTKVVNINGNSFLRY